MSIDTRHTTGRIFQEPVLHPGEDINSYHLLITDLSAVQDRLALEDPDEGPSPDPRDISFIEDTDYDQSFIVIVQYGMQSLRSLELQAIERIDGGIRLNVETDDRDGYNDDWTEFSFLEHEETDAQLFARSTEHDHVATPEEPTEGCWVYDFAAPRPASVAPKTMSPGESVTAEFSLVAPPVNDEGVPDPCLPAGTYTDGETVEYFLDGDIDSEDKPDGIVTTSLEMTLEEI